MLTLALLGSSTHSSPWDSAYAISFERSTFKKAAPGLLALRYGHRHAGVRDARCPQHSSQPFQPDRRRDAPGSIHTWSQNDSKAA